MSIMVSFSPEAEAKLRERAASAGKDVSTLVRQIVEERLEAPLSFREIFAPLHEAFDQTDMSDAQLDTLFERLRDEAWREERPVRNSP